jgi:hypothetical protein
MNEYSIKFVAGYACMFSNSSHDMHVFYQTLRFTEHLFKFVTCCMYAYVSIYQCCMYAYVSMYISIRV